MKDPYKALLAAPQFLSGQVFLRDGGKDPFGRPIMMMVGIVRVHPKHKLTA